jgi:hypothetical protein
MLCFELAIFFINNSLALFIAELILEIIHNMSTSLAMPKLGELT